MFAPTPSSLRLLRHSKEANLMKAIERNVADAGVYQHFYHIATRRLFFPQENCSISYQNFVPINLRVKTIFSLPDG